LICMQFSLGIDLMDWIFKVFIIERAARWKWKETLC
jgi:hypothetical protein